MKLLNRLDTYTITERAVAWDDSLMKRASSGVFNGFSWIGNSIKKGLQKRKLNGLVMQWGLEYVKALHAFDEGIKTENEIQDADVENDTSIETKTILTAEDKSKYLTILQKELKDIKSIKNIINSFNTWIILNNQSGYNNIKNQLDTIDILSDETILIIIQYLEKNDNISNFNTYFDNILSFIDSITTNNIVSNFFKDIKVDINKKEDFLNKIKDIQNDINKVIEVYNSAITYLSSTNESYNLFNLILEASDFKLPNNIKELIPEEDIKKLESIKDIKLKTFNKINLKTLDTLLYEANYIIDKAKNNKNENVAELQRTWDLGIKNINNYFQNVIDTEKVMKSVKSGNIDTKVKEDIEGQSNSVDELADLGLTLMKPVGGNFKDKEFYSLNINLLGQNGKKINNIYIILSPIAEFKEDVEDKTYFWFKLFGQYKTNEKGEIQRLNCFNGLTTNQSIIKNFNNLENSYIISLESLKVSNKLNKMWIYSNKGSSFYDGNILVNVNNKLEEIKKFSEKEWLKIGNIFRYNVNTRTLVDKNNLQRFPGIQSKDSVDEKGVETAKINHDLIINNLSKEK